LEGGKGFDLNANSVSAYNITSNMDYSSLNMGMRSSMNSSDVSRGGSPQFLNKLSIQIPGTNNAKPYEKSMFLNKKSAVNP
jgi:hypothetical protein